MCVLLHARRGVCPAVHMTSSQREAARSLFRQMMRVSRNWRGEGGEQEALYIRHETNRVFRASVALSADAAVDALALGHERLNLAKHYHIAYPRLHHVPLSGGGDLKSVVSPASHQAGVAISSIPIAAAVALAAAQTPPNPALDAARAKARAKRAAMSAATSST